MRRLLLAVLMTLPLLACKDETKAECEYNAQDAQLQVYNDILIELVEDHFYGLYLGDDGEDLLEKWIKLEEPDSADLASFEEERVALHNRLLGDTANFWTIYLDDSTELFKRIDELIPANLWALQADSSEVRTFLEKYSSDSKSAVQILKETQRKYSASEFRACTFKIKPLGPVRTFFELGQEQKRRAIGQVSFSKVYLDAKKEQGLLYYEFYCGTKCGKGEIIGFKKVKGRWRIVDKIQLWIA